MKNITGKCLCGAIKYSAKTEPLRTVICNCKDCQRISGSAFATVVVISDETFKLESGKTSFFVDHNQVGLPMERHFCGKCGSSLFCGYSLFSKNEKQPGTIILQAGTLDDTSWVKPGYSIWCNSAQLWALALQKDMPCYAENMGHK